MAKYVTRREFHAFEDRIMVAIGRLVTEMTAREDRLEQKFEQRFVRMRVELNADIARHVTASEERIRADIAAILDPYRDLPERVTTLEKHTGLVR